jgi:hypothetical protein
MARTGERRKYYSALPVEPHVYLSTTSKTHPHFRGIRTKHVRQAVMCVNARKYPSLLTLDGTERLKSLDSLQLHSPIFSDGYALAYAEYRQKFVLQVYGEFHTGIQGFRGECMETGNFGTSGSNEKPEKPNCQLTFEQKLNSVFPLTDS